MPKDDLFDSSTSDTPLIGESLEMKKSREEREEKVIRLAERLGVEPLKDAGTNSITIRVSDGRIFGWEDLVHASLDFMEKATKEE